MDKEAQYYYIKNAFWQSVYNYVLVQGKAIALIEAPTLPRRLDVYYEHNGWTGRFPNLLTILLERAGRATNAMNARSMARPLHELIPLDHHSIQDIDNYHRDAPGPVWSAHHA